jgi:uncharacterized membrane protein YhhN
MELKFVFLIILGVVSAVYLTLLFFKMSKLQGILKCCLIPLILAIYIFGAQKIYLPIVLALVFGWAGDIFLLKISNLKCFRFGLVSFLIGHICYIVAMYYYAKPFNYTILCISIIFTIALGIFLFRLVRPGKEMKIPVIAYETIIIIMTLFALQVFIVQGGSFGTLVLAGSLCFLVSDSLLAYNTFRKQAKLLYFSVMFTYIAAQLLIALGFSALGM